jgi:hypothetical protein
MKRHNGSAPCAAPSNRDAHAPMSPPSSSRRRARHVYYRSQAPNHRSRPEFCAESDARRGPTHRPKLQSIRAGRTLPQLNAHLSANDHSPSCLSNPRLPAGPTPRSSRRTGVVHPSVAQAAAFLEPPAASGRARLRSDGGKWWESLGFKKTVQGSRTILPLVPGAH